MVQYLLAVRYSDVPAFDAKLEDVGVFVFHGGLRSPETTATVARQSGERGRRSVTTSVQRS